MLGLGFQNRCIISICFLNLTNPMRLYALLRERDIAFISVGHRPTLKAFHHTVLDLPGDGGWRLIPATSYDFGQA